MSRLLFVPLLLLFICCLTPLAAQTVHREVLENGLTVISVDRRDTHVAQIMVLVRSGVAEEGPYLGSGISRTLQSLIVNGAREQGNEVARLGNQLKVLGEPIISPERSAGLTGFSLTTTDRFFADALEVIAGLLRNPTIDQVGLDRSRRLLAAAEENELRTSEALALRHLSRLVFRQHPARIPARGFNAQRDALQVEDLQSFHRNTYTANRMTVIVVGNIDSQRVLSEARRTFTDLPGNDWQPPPELIEPIQFAPRGRIVSAPVSSDLHLYGWRVPAISYYHDHAALELAQIIIKNRLEQDFAVERDGHRLAEQPQVKLIAPPDNPGLFTISYRPSALGSDDAWFALQSVLDDLRNNGPSAAELAVSKRIWQRQQAEHLAMVAGAAIDLARWERAVGAPAFGVRYRDALGQLTSDAVRQVVAQHLHAKGANRSQIVLTQPSDKEIPAPGTRSTLTDVAPQVTTTAIGARLLHRYMPIGLAHVRLTLHAGPSVEREDSRGATQLLSKLLPLGTRNRQGNDFAQWLSDRGMRLEVTATTHQLQLHLLCFPEDVKEALQMLVTLLKSPALPEAALERAISQQRSQLTQIPEHWQGRLIHATDQAMLANHYAATDVEQQRSALEAMDREQLLDWFGDLAVAENLVFSVYGEFDSSGLADTLNDLLSAEPSLRSGTIEPLPGSGWDEVEAAAFTTLSAEAGGEAIALTWRAPGLDDHNRDSPAMDVLTALLTGNAGRGGRLARALSNLGINPDDALRVHRRLLRGRGYWSVLVKVPDTRLEEVRDVVLAEISTVVRALTSSEQEHQDGLSDRQIEAAKSLSANARVLAMEDQARASLVHANSLLRGIPLAQELAYHARLAAVERSDLARLATTYLSASPLIIQMAQPQNSEEAPSTPPDTELPLAPNPDTDAQ